MSKQHDASCLECGEQAKRRSQCEECGKLMCAACSSPFQPQLCVICAQDRGTGNVNGLAGSPRLFS